MIKQCACCGKEFNAKYKEAKYCSRECSHKAYSAFAKERKTKRKQEALEKKQAKKRLAEDARKARDMKMSYGQYKAQKFIKRVKGWGNETV